MRVFGNIIAMLVPLAAAIVFLGVDVLWQYNWQILFVIIIANFTGFIWCSIQEKV